MGSQLGRASKLAYLWPEVNGESVGRLARFWEGFCCNDSAGPQFDFFEIGEGNDFHPPSIGPTGLGLPCCSDKTLERNPTPKSVESDHLGAFGLVLKDDQDSNAARHNTVADQNIVTFDIVTVDADAILAPASPRSEQGALSFYGDIVPVELENVAEVDYAVFETDVSLGDGPLSLPVHGHDMVGGWNTGKEPFK